MRTTKEISNNIKNGIITEEMLDLALWSVNKRAKNYRDKQREYVQYNWGKYRDYNVSQAKANKNVMHSYKETLLTLISPSVIHKEPVYDKVRVFDYQSKYNKLRKKHSSDIVWENCYYDRDFGCEVYFFDFFNKEKIIDYHYYLFYEMPTHTYHNPINKEQISSYDLKVKEIDQLETEGNEINDLMSLQTVKKIVELVKSGNYQYLVTAH